MTLGIICVILGFLLAFCYNSIEDRRNEKVCFSNAFNKTDMPVVRLKCGNKDIHLLVDTGSDISYISPSALKIFKDEVVSNKGVHTNIVGGTASSENKTVESVLPITFDSKTVNEPFIAVNSLDSQFDHVRQIKGISIHGIIGTSFLKKHKAVIDFNKLHMKLWKK